MIEKAKTEKELREASDPWPKTPQELQEYIASLVKREHDYGTCVYAMSLAAIAAFHYVSHELGVTGFQAQCADLDFLSRSRHMKGPFMIVDGENALYPQYDLIARLQQSLDEWKPWLKEQAKKHLSEKNGHEHPEVLEHWKKLAAWR